MNASTASILTITMTAEEAEGLLAELSDYDLDGDGSEALVALAAAIGEAI